MSENKNNLENEVFQLNRKKEDLLRKNFDLERQNHRMELKLEHVQTEVRDLTNSRKDRKYLPTIFFITPTKFKPEQKADLTRLGQTLIHIPNLFWIIVEDSDEPTMMPKLLLKRLNFKSAYHLAIRTPEKFRMNSSDPNWKYPRGVVQRNAALQYIRTNHRGYKKSVIYFGDDDNVYDWRLFEEMRKINKIGIWPVGIVGGMIVETPILASNGTIVGFNSIWKPDRPFPIDMAAFAVNTSLVIQNPDAKFSYDVPRGYQESHFLTSLGLTRMDLEPKAEFCSKVYVWHTRTEKSKLSKIDRKRIEMRKLTDLEKDAINEVEEAIPEF
uniref:Galactosylgalactosylxylosylprotein 3-beta-glucuronosyltransferase n=1 Tax=Panagrolaimus sp. JU765 TaxID=591449 RepID=A0AC34R3S2_9BILA